VQNLPINWYDLMMGVAIPAITSVVTRASMDSRWKALLNLALALLLAVFLSLLENKFDGLQLSAKLFVISTTAQGFYELLLKPSGAAALLQALPPNDK